MTFEEALDLALQSSEPLQGVRSLAEQLARDGFSKAAVLEQFEQCRQSLRVQGKDREEDLLLEVMDFIEGWCSPHMKIGGEAANPDGTSSSESPTPGNKPDPRAFFLEYYRALPDVPKTRYETDITYIPYMLLQGFFRIIKPPNISQERP